LIITEQEIEKLRANVKRGAELLDNEKPYWRGRINRDTLRIDDVHSCVLGQLGDDGYYGYSALIDYFWDESYEATYDFATDHGFDGETYHMDILTRLWLEELDAPSSESTMV
jgi:hypothetical protein